MVISPARPCWDSGDRTRLIGRLTRLLQIRSKKNLCQRRLRPYRRGAAWKNLTQSTPCLEKYINGNVVADVIESVVGFLMAHRLLVVLCFLLIQGCAVAFQHASAPSAQHSMLAGIEDYWLVSQKETTFVVLVQNRDDRFYRADMLAGKIMSAKFRVFTIKDEAYVEIYMNTYQEYSLDQSKGNIFNDDYYIVFKLDYSESKSTLTPLSYVHTAELLESGTMRNDETRNCSPESKSNEPITELSGSLSQPADGGHGTWLCVLSFESMDDQLSFLADNPALFPSSDVISLDKIWPVP